MLAVVRQSGFRRRLYRLVKDLVRAAHLQRLRLRIRLGLGDPADTGRLSASKTRNVIRLRSGRIAPRQRRGRKAEIGVRASSCESSGKIGPLAERL